MNKFLESFKEVITAILPMTVIIFLMSITIAKFDFDLMVSFFAGTIFMIFGMTLFLFGASFSIMDVGYRLGAFLMEKRKIVAVIVFGFLIGCLITIAEPDVQVLSNQVYKVSEGIVPKLQLSLFVGIGVGIFIVIGILRIIFQRNLLTILMIGYTTAFLLAIFFTSPTFVPVAFDAGGVTTGPLTVPFILAFASGITSVIGTTKESTDKQGDNSFGLVGLASLGPIIAVLLLGVIYK